MDAPGEAMQPPASRRAVFLLGLGAALGAALAAAGLVGGGHSGGGALPADVVARINGTAIRTEDYERAVAALAGDRRDGADVEQRRHVLDRLIDEELIIQRGLELGLARQDPKVRADLTAAVIASIVSEQADLQPSDAELERFYDEQRDFFVQPGRIRVRGIFRRVATGGDDAAALAQSQAAAQRLRAGEPFGAVRAALGDPEIAPLPDALLPQTKLMDYLGPTAVRGAVTLAVGEVSEPLRSNGGYYVLQMVERQADGARPFVDIRPQVLEEYRRRAGERALRAYLDDLRARAAVTVAPQLP